MQSGGAVRRAQSALGSRALVGGNIKPSDEASPPGGTFSFSGRIGPIVQVQVL